MDPHTYCRQVIADLLSKSRRQDAGPADRQVAVVLAYFALQNPSERDFDVQLALLADSADRSHRPSLAAAARAILQDWRRRPPPARLRPAGRAAPGSGGSPGPPGGSGRKA